MSRSNLSLLFPGCEALDDDINVDINTTGTPADAAEAATEAEDLATEGADTQAEAEETSTAAEAFAHQFSELCALHKHISRYGVNRTLLALVNRNNIFGRALNLNLPATESFDSVGSPNSSTSIVCLEALSEGLWQKFKDFISRIVKAIRNFGLKMTQWWRDLSGNYETRLQQFDEFFKRTNLELRDPDSLRDFKSWWVDPTEIVKLMTEYENDYKSAGNGNEAVDLINRSKDVIDAVLRAGSSNLATTGADSATAASKLIDDIKKLSDELSEKAQENRDKILDKLEEIKDKYSEKLSDLEDKAKELDLKDLFGVDETQIQSEKDSIITVGTSGCNDARKLIAEIRSDNERNSLFSPALKTALDRLERSAIMKNGTGMNLDTRDAITRSVSTAQQIISKYSTIQIFAPKILSMVFKNLSTIKKLFK